MKSPNNIVDYLDKSCYAASFVQHRDWKLWEEFCWVGYLASVTSVLAFIIWVWFCVISVEDCPQYYLNMCVIIVVDGPVLLHALHRDAF